MMSEGPKRIHVSWDTYFDLLRRLVAAIRASDVRPEQIVCIARGGLIPGDILSRALHAPLAIISVASYPDQKTEQEKMMFSRDLTTATPLRRRSVLVVDDLTESGKTLQMTKEWLCWWYEIPKHEVKTATLWHKTWSALTPDFYAETVTPDPDTGVRPWIEQPQELFANKM
ncbi:MAG: phosphoribosyltransferase family protein [Patescibacteria group bacterium]